MAESSFASREIVSLTANMGRALVGKVLRVVPVREPEVHPNKYTTTAICDLFFIERCPWLESTPVTVVDFACWGKNIVSSPDSATEPSGRDPQLPTSEVATTDVGSSIVQLSSSAPLR